jgi:hypothetical protein
MVTQPGHWAVNFAKKLERHSWARFYCPAVALDPL